MSFTSTICCTITYKCTGQSYDNTGQSQQYCTNVRKLSFCFFDNKTLDITYVLNFNLLKKF